MRRTAIVTPTPSRCSSPGCGVNSARQRLKPSGVSDTGSTDGPAVASFPDFHWRLAVDGGSDRRLTRGADRVVLVCQRAAARPWHDDLHFRRALPDRRIVAGP